MNYPYFFAKFYDLIYDKIRTETDMEYYLRKIAETDGPILEIGVGTGRFFSEAIKTGADIYGIDMSESMLDVLRKKIDKSDHHRVSQQNGIDFKLDQQFELILAPFRVFSHLLTTEEQLMTLNNIGHHLTDNGKLIFDLYVPNPEMLVSGMDNVIDFEGEYKPGLKLIRKTSMRADLVNQISDVSMKLSWDEPEGSRNEIWDFKFRFFYRYEIEHLIRISDLTLLDFFGDFEENPLGPDSKEFIVICGKK